MVETRCKFWRATTLAAVLFLPVWVHAERSIGDISIVAGHPGLQEWLLPDRPPYPEGNKPNAARVSLGRMLFFDPRLSGDGNMSCATCHNPMFGWSDGLPTARGFQSQVLGRATPTIINTAYNELQMWDGRKHSLEDQAMGPLEAGVEMNMLVDELVDWLQGNKGYRSAFALAYPGEEIDGTTASKAIASFERTIVSRDSLFDAWVRGDPSAMTAAQVNGFKVFLDPGKGNCAACHQAPNFTDDGFHNLGLSSSSDEEADPGRYAQKPIRLMQGAFKTPTLRDVARTAPYFHDGSAATLAEVVDHYVRGGDVKDNLSPNMKVLSITDEEKHDLIAFLHALNSPEQATVLPTLPEGGPVSWAAWRPQPKKDRAVAHNE